MHEILVYAWLWCKTSRVSPVLYKEEALSAAGGAPWHKPWYAPYINSLAEYTIDMQLADRNAEKAMIESQEQIPKEETPNGC